MRIKTWVPTTWVLCATLLLFAACDLFAQAALQAPAEAFLRNQLSARFKNVGITDEF